MVENPFTIPKKALKIDEEEEKANEKAGNQANKAGFDPYDISDAVDIFTKYNENWINKVLGFEKWNEKKDALEDFIRENASVMKITSSHTISSMHMMLKRLILDSNVQVSISAIKIIGFLCKGLRKGFFAQAKALFPFLFEKLRDKKGGLLEETQKTLENMLFCLGIDEVFETVKETLEGKNTQGKLNGLIWVEKALMRSDSMNGLKNSMTVFKKLMDDGSNEVRTLVMNLLGRLINKVGIDKKQMILKEIPEGKLAKFKEISEKELKSIEIPPKKETITIIEPVDIGKSEIIKQNDKNTFDSNKKDMKNIKKDSVITAKKPEKETNKIEETTLMVYEEVNNICEEEAERILKENGIYEKLLKGLSSNDWKEKQKTIASFNENIPEITTYFEELLVFIRGKLKNFKTSQFPHK